MIINFEFEAQVLAVKQNDYNGKTYYNAVLFLNDTENPEAGTFKIPEEVAKRVIPNKSYLFKMCYNDKYDAPYIKGVAEVG